MYNLCSSSHTILIIGGMAMIRVIVIDISGMYSRIYDEIYMSSDEFERNKYKIIEYKNKGYVVVVCRY